MLTLVRWPWFVSAVTSYVPNHKNPILSSWDAAQRAHFSRHALPPIPFGLRGPLLLRCPMGSWPKGRAMCGPNFYGSSSHGTRLVMDCALAVGFGFGACRPRWLLLDSGQVEPCAFARTKLEIMVGYGAGDINVTCQCLSIVPVTAAYGNLRIYVTLKLFCLKRRKRVAGSKGIPGLGCSSLRSLSLAD